MKITDFKEQLRQGEKITRSCWEPYQYICEDGSLLSIHGKDLLDTTRLGIDDIEADDWMLFMTKEERQLNLLHMVMESYRTKPELGFEYYDVQLKSILNKE
ncbi:hypothetical protein ITQ94_09140 [Pediococcus pentosaceus]|uniref:hypothetical protein n=1 Tax=Pediococcus pentosaceus TaxID=1255 RepID=UPI0018FE1E73|nr:hypothetical protein [Pediococcus pentosaceus]MBF7131601.1 hypothetical protein [Pediococcus pentosaceus]